jgi:beta-lactamase regulating signal transducer with metallopeptidase domain
MNTILEQINYAGFVFVKFAVPMLVQSSVLIVVLLLADLLLRKKVRAVVRYWLWMLVLLKLLLPTTLSSPVSLGRFMGEPVAAINLDAQQYLSPAVAASEPKLDSPSAVTADIRLAASSAEPTHLAVLLTWQGVVLLLWLGVVCVMLLLLLQRAVFVCGLVRQSAEADGLMNDTLKSCCRKMGVRQTIGLKVSPNATSPAVCGLFRPVILLPQNLAPALGSSRLPVLLHELAHISRGDLWVNLAQTILQIIYFYNPLLWLANSIIRRIREQAVDEAVLVAMGANAPQYPQTLVDVAKLAFNRPVLSLRLIGIVESKSALKGRIERMLNRPIPKTAKLGILGLIALLIFAAVFLPMTKSKPKPPEFVIKGTVTDADTSRPVAGAKIGDEQYAESKQSTTTDANGYYSYSTWYEEHNIKCEAPGYKTQNKLLYTKLLGSEKEKVLDFDLEHSNSPQNTVEGKKQQPTDTNAKKAEILKKLVVLEEHRNRFQRDVDATERALGEVRDRWGITDFEEHNYPPPIVERLNRLQKEQDDCTLEISQLKARADNLKKEAQTEQEKKELKDTENHLVELQAKFDALEKMRTEAALRKTEIDLARIQYKQRAAIRDERLQRYNETKAQIEKLRLMYDNPEVFDTLAEVEDKSKVGDKDKTASDNLAAAETSGKTPEKIVEQAVMTISTCAETDPQVKQSLKSLQGLDENAVAKELVKFLDSGKNTIRRSAIYILWKGDFKSIKPAELYLLNLCSHEEEYTRGMAALALGTRKVEPAFDTLCNMTLNDSSAYARRCAAYALGLMGNPKGKDVLEKARKDSDFNVRNNAEAALTMLSQAEKPK